MSDNRPDNTDQEGAHFVDKRRFKDESDEPVRSDAPAGDEQRTADAPPKADPEEPRLPHLTELPDVYSLMSAYVATLGSQAFVWMGLLKDPFAGKIRKDLAQAKIEIDACEFMIGQIAPALGEEDRRELQRMVTDLKVNFVSQSQAAK